METESGHSKSPAWCRARIAAIRKLIDELPVDRSEKNPDRSLVRNGFIPENLKPRFEQLLDYEYKLTFALNDPLSFVDLTSFNTWFVMHPKKVCGEESVSTSREFPIKITGNQEDIERTIKAGISEQEEEPIKSQFEQDVENNISEEDFGQNRFGNAEDIQGWSLADFHSCYYDQLMKFEEEHKPTIDRIDQIKEKLKVIGHERGAKKELTDEKKQLEAGLNRDRLIFEGEWMSFWGSVREMIRKRAQEYGFSDDDIESYDIPGDILLAMTERPWTETYWDWKVKDVINNELNSLTFPRKLKTEHDSKFTEENLELEALAIETELLLLVLSEKEMGRSMQ